MDSHSIEKSAFLGFVSDLISHMREAGVVFFHEENAVIPSAVRLRLMPGKPSPSYPISNSKSEYDSLLENHLKSLLSISIPSKDGNQWAVVDVNYKFNGTYHHCVITSNKQLNLHEYTFRFPIMELDVACFDTLTYCTQLMSWMQDYIEILLPNNDSVYIDGIGCNAQIVKIGMMSPDHYINIGNRVSSKEMFKEGVQPLASIASTEPTIMFLAYHWSLLARIFNFKEHGIKDFALLSNEDWVSSCSGHPSAVYEYLGRVCNVKCDFCYLFGNTNEVAIARGSKVISDNELDTRLKYYDPINKLSMFKAQWEINEILVDPKFYKTLAQLRERTEEPFWLITNGNPLTDKMINFLKQVKPVNLIISTNTFDTLLRSSVMHERESLAMRSYSALTLLEEAEINYGVSLVAFPGLKLETLYETVKKLDTTRAAFVRINLHGFTKTHPLKPANYTEDDWIKVTKFIREFREKVNIPVIIIPSAFEENYFYENPNAPRIIGTILNSPGRAAKLLPGDEIVQVGLFNISTRSQLISILSSIKGSVELKVLRNNEFQKILLDVEQENRYPYSGAQFAKYFFPAGIVISPSISSRDINAIFDTIKNHHLKHVLILTSSIMQKAAEYTLAQFTKDNSLNINIYPVKNDTLGGNIQVLDMAGVVDIACTLNQYIEAYGEPEAIFLPTSGFNKYGRDITGKHIGDLQRWYKIPIFLLNKTNQFAF